MDCDHGRAAEPRPHGDEGLDLLRYVALIWKHKVLILSGTLIGAVAATLFCFNMPPVYTTTYQYPNERLLGKAYKMLLGQFFSETNTAWLTSQLQERGMSDDIDIGLAGSVRLDVWPEILRDDNGSGRVKPEDIQWTLELRSELLLVHVTAHSKEQTRTLGQVVRDNIENVLVLRDVVDELERTVSESRSRLAELEESRFGTQLALRTETQTLERLKALQVSSPAADSGNINLQFALGSQTDFLPLPLHISSTEKQIVELEEQAYRNTQQYDYHQQLISVEQDLLAKAREAISLRDGLVAFVRFLDERTRQESDSDVGGYLAGYSKRLENRIASRKPVTDAPVIRRTGTSKLRMIVVATGAALLTCVLLSFVVEALAAARRRI